MPASSATYRPDERRRGDLRGRLGDARRAVRRGVLRRRRLLSALCVGGAVLLGLQAAAPAPPPTVLVLTAARDLPAGTVLRGGDVAPVRFRPDSAPDGRPARAAVVGRTLAAPLRRGEPVTDVRLVGPSLLRGYPGLVAVPARIPDPGTVALLRVGDRVDLMVTETDGSSSRLLAGDVPVLALPADTDVTARRPSRADGWSCSGPLPRSPGAVTAAAVRGCLGVVISR